MLGVLITVLACFGAVGFGDMVTRKLQGSLDPAARIGISGLIGLGILGLLTFALGLVGTGWFPMGLSLLVSSIGLVYAVKLLKKPELPKGADLLFLLAIGLALLMCLFGVLAPSDANDWDSLAYHLAVPKMWLLDGQIHVIPTIHQSNFPFTVDSLYLLGLKWGSYAGAKAFTWCYTVLGLFALFGLARQRYGQRAGWWATLAFSTVPVVMWESGTAYVDVAHGFFAGLGLIFACLWLESDDDKNAWLSAILLGFAMGSKYTGLQTIAVAGLVALVGALMLKRKLKPVFVIGLVALAIGSPWYVKNAIWKDNPVFPFFYSKLHGKDWDQRRADIYTREQNGFGVGRAAPPDGGIEPARLGHSVLGLAYQPGRYVNPAQTVGMGDPMGAIGVAIVGAFLIALLAGQRKPFEKSLLAAVIFSLLMWFVLTQQSRYIIALAVPLSLLAGQLTTRKAFGPIVMGLIGLQAVYSLGLTHDQRFSDQLNVVLGKTSQEDYLARIPFYPASKAINELGPSSKTALYDEVFGYLLDVPYMWANPGHGMTIPYDSMETGKQYADGMRGLGFTHVYMNLRPVIKGELAAEMVAALQGKTFPPDRRKALMDNWELRFNVLVAEAVQSGDLEIVSFLGNPQRPSGVLLRFTSTK